MPVKIVQCLCPHRHCIAALAYEDQSGAADQSQQQLLREGIRQMISAGQINPWCGLCGAPVAAWFYETELTRFSTLAEALPHLAAEERQQMKTTRLLDRMGMTFDKARHN
ncbi:MAG: hypothetical protein U0Z53_23615 [Blastocatellia bacterium]